MQRTHTLNAIATEAPPAPRSAEALPTPRSVRVAFAPYVRLMKPHVTVMLLGVTLAAMAVAVGGLPPLGLTLATLIGGAMAAGSANAINCFWDRDIDTVMRRTRSRPLPSGQVDSTHALVFGVLLGVGSFTLFAVFVNWLSALLALSAILFYVIIYTMWLKRRTAQNIVIGGAAGAFPVVIGWAAVTHTVSPLAVWMFLIIFLWTPPHFWALALVLKNDYARAGIPMLPVVRGENETYWQIVIYSVVLALTSLVPVFTGSFGWIYLGCALALGLGLVGYAVYLFRMRATKVAHSLFWLSNQYLALIFAAMVVDRVFH